MKEYILIDNTLQVKKIVSLTEEKKQVISFLFSYIIEKLPEHSTVAVGQYYDPATNTFSTRQLGMRVLTKYQFRKKFTSEELVKMDNLQTFVTLTPLQAAQYNTLVKNFEAAQEIDLDNEDVIYGINLLQQFGVLTEERKIAILS